MMGLIVNHDERQRTVPITIDGFEPGGLASVWSFATTHPLQQGVAVDITHAITFEPESATMLIIPSVR